MALHSGRCICFRLRFYWKYSPQDFADMLGWKELASKVDSTYSQLPKDEYTFVLCDNYGQAGAVNYHTTNKKIKAVTFHADYINWFDLHPKIENVIRVKVFEESKEELGLSSPFFNASFVAGSINNPLAREYGTTLFLLRKAKADINQKLRLELEKRKMNDQINATVLALYSMINLTRHERLHSHQVLRLFAATCFINV